MGRHPAGPYASPDFRMCSNICVACCKPGRGTTRRCHIPTRFHMPAHHVIRRQAPHANAVNAKTNIRPKIHRATTHPNCKKPPGWKKRSLAGTGSKTKTPPQAASGTGTTSATPCRARHHRSAKKTGKTTGRRPSPGKPASENVRLIHLLSIGGQAVLNNLPCTTEPGKQDANLFLSLPSLSTFTLPAKFP